MSVDIYNILYVLIKAVLILSRLNAHIDSQDVLNIYIYIYIYISKVL